MNPIPFERISLEQVREALEKEAIKADAQLPQKRDWAPARARMDDGVQELMPETFKWLAMLPASVRPKKLPALYPRIANRIAALWTRPLQCERYLDELMLDQRGSREGFQPGVGAEIAALKVHFFSTAKIVHFGVWGNRIGVD
jgi:hypothetical protein